MRLFLTITIGLIGLGIGSICALMALAMTGAGHGWISPLLPSLAVPVLTPIALVRLVRGDRARRGISIALVMLAIGMDLFLLVATLREGTEYYRRVAEGAFAPLMLWFATWSLWQLAAAITLWIAPLKRLGGFLRRATGVEEHAPFA